MILLEPPVTDLQVSDVPIAQWALENPDSAGKPQKTAKGVGALSFPDPSECRQVACILQQLNGCIKRNLDKGRYPAIILPAELKHRYSTVQEVVKYIYSFLCPQHQIMMVSGVLCGWPDKSSRNNRAVYCPKRVLIV